MRVLHTTKEGGSTLVQLACYGRFSNDVQCGDRKYKMVSVGVAIIINGRAFYAQQTDAIRSHPEGYVSFAFHLFA